MYDKTGFFITKNIKKTCLTHKKVDKVSIMLDKPIDLENAISVTEISLRVKSCMDSPYFKGLSIYGEVSGFKMSGPHAYFTLKDSESSINCVMFYAARHYNPKDGESVLIKGGLDYYQKRGSLTLQVSEITPIGKGLLFIEFEKLKAQLLSEGIFDETHKIPIPKFPKNVLVLTSKTGAVIRDIVTTIRRKNPVINIVVKDVRVQGVDAAKDIAKSLAIVDKLNYDVIIIARGGGSLEDLAPFYDETLVRTIYDCVTPIVSAVGHETDFSLCDFVADYRAATPTAAGELVGYDYYGLVDEFRYDVSALQKLMQNRFSDAINRVTISTQKLQHLASSFYQDREKKVLLNLEKCKSLINLKVQNSSMILKNYMDSLDNLNPLKILKRGYFKIQIGKDTINQVKNIKVGDEIKATGMDGEVTAIVKDIKLNGDKL